MAGVRPRLRRAVAGLALSVVVGIQAVPAVVGSGPASLAPGEHWIGTRPAAAGGTELFDRRTGNVFVPRGVNLLKDELQSSGPYPVLDMLVAPGHYDDTWTRTRFKGLAKLGYNTVRVWLDHCPGDCLTNPDGSAKPAWLDNVAALLAAARSYGLAVILASNELPEVGYADRLPSGGTFDGGFSATILSTQGIDLTLSYWRMVIGGLQARGAPLEAVLGYELLNETFLELDRNPLALTSGLVTTANGQTYDMGNQASRDAMVDDGLAYWAGQAAAVIRALDPSALVTTGFFAPEPGTRLVRTAFFATHAAVDFIDVHHYPGLARTLATDIAAMGLAGYTAKPVLLGEFGAFRAPFPDAAAAANGLAEFQAQSCSAGVDGWLTWVMGSLDPSIYGVEADKSVILKSVSPAKRPDPCATTGYRPNLALGRPVTATAESLGFEAVYAVDGLSHTAWTAGSSGPAAVTIDLGSALTISEVRLEVAQYAPGPTTQQLEIGTATGTWTIVAVFSGTTQDGQWLRWIPSKAVKGVRYLRVTTTNSAFWPAWFEIQAY